MNRWRVVVGGVSMNLALGSLYAWSVFVLPLEREFGWTRAQTSWVFTIAIVTFAVTFIFAGRMQDVRGPRLCAFLGAVLVSLGFFLASFTTSLAYLYLIFAVVCILRQARIGWLACLITSKTPASDSGEYLSHG